MFGTAIGFNVPLQYLHSGRIHVWKMKEGVLLM